MLLSVLLPVLAVASAANGAAAKKSTTTTSVKHSSSTTTHHASTTLPRHSSTVHLPTHPSSHSTTKSTLSLPTAKPTVKMPTANVPGFTTAKPSTGPSKAVGTKVVNSVTVIHNNEASARVYMSKLSENYHTPAGFTLTTTATAKAKGNDKTGTTSNHASSTSTKKAAVTSTTLNKQTTTITHSSSSTPPKKSSTTTKGAATTKKASTTTSSHKLGRRNNIKVATTNNIKVAVTTSAVNSAISAAGQLAAGAAGTLQTGCNYSEPLPYTYYSSYNNSAAGFLLDTTYATSALNNLLPPAGYTTQWVNALGAVTAPGYMGMTQNLTSYNTSACAAYCDKSPGCVGFNIYFQRNALYEPWSPGCVNPPARTAIQCGFYSTYITVNQTTNLGLWESNFAVVISGSNGYWRNPPPPAVANFHGPTAQTGAMSFTNNYISYSYLSTYSPSTCANACTALNAQRRSIATSWYSATGGQYTPCNSFNMFNASTNGVVQAYVCVLYSADTASTGNTAVSTINYGGVTYTTSYSYTYDLYPKDTGSIYNTWTAAPQGTSASCSSLAASGSQVTDYSNIVWNLACGYNIASYDLSSVSGVSDFYSCFYKCSQVTNCNAFSYGWGTCYFKNVVNGVIAPTSNNYNVDFAWMDAAAYAGYSARNATTATVTGATVTSAWTGSYTTTITQFIGTVGTVVVQTPGTVAPSSTSIKTSLSSTVGVTSFTSTSTSVSYSTSTSYSTATRVQTQYIGFWPFQSITRITSYATSTYYNTLTSTSTATSTITTTTTSTSTISSTYAWYTAATDSGTATVISTTTISPNSLTKTILTIYPTPTPCSSVSTGANYALYTNNFEGGQNTYGYPNYSPESYKSIKPYASGVSSYIAEDNWDGTAISVYGNNNIDPTNLVIQNTFYVYAGRGSGTYTFQIPYADDIEMVWIGSKAISGWTRLNADLLQVWTGDAQATVSLGYYLNFGQYLPVRVQYANGGGAGSLELYTWAPDGSFMLQWLGPGSNNAAMSPNIVTGTCSPGQGAAFPAWGSES